MFGLFKKKSASYFSEEENQQIIAAIQRAEQRTSGEVRIFVEKRCEYVDPLRRAREIFYSLKMTETAQRNGVLLYIAMKDKQLAIFGDEGIHARVGNAFWNEEVQKMLRQFNKENYTEGIVQIIADIGEALVANFPYDGQTDKNELPDEIVFG